MTTGQSKYPIIEYKTIDLNKIKDPDLFDLNEIGLQGWFLVHKEKTVYIFARRKVT